MADMGGPVSCNESCGCPTPCPGGAACRCVGAGVAEHSRCSCGSHCGCNPCRCGKVETAGVGRAHCKCGEGCACARCGA